MHKFSSSDRAVLLRLASSLPKGSDERRAILAVLSGVAAEKQTWKCTSGPREGDTVSFAVPADSSKDEDEQFVKAFEKATKLKLENGPALAEEVETKDGSEWELQKGKTAGYELEGPDLPGDNMAPDIFDSLLSGFTREGSTLDEHLLASKREGAFERVRELTDKIRGAKALTLPVEAGTKVMFAGHFGSIFAYENPPTKEATGEVVVVRSATGDITAHDGLVFVKWADGRFLPVHAEHLRLAKPKTAKVARTFTAACIPADVNRFKVAGLGDITSFLSKVSNNTLVHRSQKDLWSFSKGADGGVTVQRLFNSNGEALKG